jgi:hypothetical protein
LCSNWKKPDGENGRIPNGLLGVLLKKFWPGLYTVNPDLPKKLADRWEDYEAAHHTSFSTSARAVTTTFWVWLLLNYTSPKIC